VLENGWKKLEIQSGKYFWSEPNKYRRLKRQTPKETKRTNIQTSKQTKPNKHRRLKRQTCHTQTCDQVRTKIKLIFPKLRKLQFKKIYKIQT
jgi:hypothetical protein